ncbi:MAG: phosphonoacetaldehyde reductase [Synergistaceae bacterium]|nr:phosphonoacetaldehyde reductase [Synergistaceae bacterium]
MQQILNNYDELQRILQDKTILFIHGKSAEKFSRVYECLRDKRVFHFTSFTPNPIIEDAKAASNFFTLNKCGIILAVGGGSAIDTAKYVKLNNPDSMLVVIPTTAGSGSEATKFAVLYEGGKKLSITDEKIIPDSVLFDSELLKYLPDYHRKSSALDAFSHSLESFWSVNADESSKKFSREALTNITRLLENYPGSYNPEEMLKNSYLAGQAINLAQTTAGHAMCYKITGLYNIAHGHAAALCNRVLFKWLIKHENLPVLNDIAACMNCGSPEKAAEKFSAIFMRLGLEIPEANEQEINILSASVNPERLKNFPAKLDLFTIKNLYREILN